MKWGTSLIRSNNQSCLWNLEVRTLGPRTLWKVASNHYEVLLNLVHMVPSLQLAETALHHRDLLIAERCYAALGDVARARYMQEVGEIWDFDNLRLCIAHLLNCCNGAVWENLGFRVIEFLSAEWLQVNKVKEKAIKELGIDGQNHFLVRARLALLQHQWKVFYYTMVLYLAGLI